MRETTRAEFGIEVEDRCPLVRVAERGERVVEEPLEGQTFRCPRGSCDVLEVPLHDELREAGEREVIEVELPGERELASSHLVQQVGHCLPFSVRLAHPVWAGVETA